MLTNEEKLAWLEENLQANQYHIDFLERAIQENPNGDIEGKPARQSLLEDHTLKVDKLKSEINKIKGENK